MQGRGVFSSLGCSPPLAGGGVWGSWEGVEVGHGGVQGAAKGRVEEGVFG